MNPDTNIAAGHETENKKRRGCGNKKNKQALTPEQYLSASSCLAEHLKKLASGKSFGTKIKGLSKKKLIHAHINQINHLIKERNISINQIIFVINSAFIQCGLTPLDASTVNEYIWKFMTAKQSEKYIATDIDNWQV